jgi:hypothetical protein
MGRKKKKETYRDKWLKEHPDIHIHLPRDVYEKLLKLENILGKSKNDIVKDLINGAAIKFEEYGKKIEEEIRNKIYNECYNATLELFLESPDIFYNEIRKKYKIDPILFSVPCLFCHKPIVFTHKDKYRDQIKDILYSQFRDAYHDCCEEVMNGIRDTCEHMKK